MNSKAYDIKPGHKTTGSLLYTIWKEQNFLKTETATLYLSAIHFYGTDFLKQVITIAMNIQVNISLCRVCMKSEICKSMLEDELLHTKFEFVTHLRVKTGDNLPALICEKCILLLHLSHKFIQNAHDTERNLKTFLAKINNDFKMVTKSATETTGNVNSDEVDEMLELIGVSESSITTEKLTTTSKPSSIKIPNEKCNENSKTNQTFIENEEKYEVRALDEIIEEKPSLENKDCSPNSNDSNSKDGQLLKVKDDMESLIDFQGATDITKRDNQFMDLDSLLVTDEDTVQLSEDPINEQHLKCVTYTEEYEALLEDDSASMDIILYEDEESTVFQPADFDDVDCNALKLNNEATFAVELASPNDDAIEDENVKTVVEEKEPFSMLNETETPTTSSTKQSTPTKSTENLVEVESRRFYCSKCKRDFSTKTNLTRHLALHDGKRPFQCDICQKGFSQNGTLKQHMYIHTGEKPYVCAVCKRGFTQSKSLVFHMRRHSGEKPHQCDYCCLLFRQKDALKVHILKHHMDANERVFSCKICNKEMSVQALRNHMKSHVNNHKLADDTSDIMQLIDETELLSESVLISNEVSLKVDGSTHVIDVMATSTTEPRRAKKFQCRKCFKCFAIKKNLIRHLSFHDIESNYLHQCEFCQSFFGSSDALQAHCAQFHEKTTGNTIDGEK